MKDKYAAGAPAPTTTFMTTAGDEKSLEDYKGKWVILMFRRYLGCPLCRREIEPLLCSEAGCAIPGTEGEHIAPDGDLEIIITLQSSPQVVLETYPMSHPQCVTLVPDPASTLYHDFGVNKCTVFKYLTPAVLKAANQAKKEGYKHGAKEGEERQLPAEFIVDPAGIIRFARYGSNIADSASLAELMQIKEGLSRVAK